MLAVGPVQTEPVQAEISGQLPPWLEGDLVANGTGYNEGMVSEGHHKAAHWILDFSARFRLCINNPLLRTVAQIQACALPTPHVCVCVCTCVHGFHATGAFV